LYNFTSPSLHYQQSFLEDWKVEASPGLIGTYVILYYKAVLYSHFY